MGDEGQQQSSGITVLLLPVGLIKVMDHRDLKEVAVLDPKEDKETQIWNFGIDYDTGMLFAGGVPEVGMRCTLCG